MKIHVVALADEDVPESDARVAVALHAHRRRSAERWLDAKLAEVRENPEAALKWLEESLLRGLSALGDPGPEHTKQTGRRAGGGQLRTGS